MERLSADDRLLLASDATWPQDVGVIVLMDGGDLLDRQGRFPIEVALEALDRGVRLLPRLRQVLRVPPRGLGGPLWVDSPSFDLRDHVRVAPVSGPGDEEDLLTTVELIRRRRLDASRPLWEVWIITGLADGRVGMFVRMHHVVADGVAGIASLVGLLADPSAAPAHEAGPSAPAPAPTSRQLVIDNVRSRAGRLRRGLGSIRHPGVGLRTVRSAWPAVSELVAGPPGPVTSLGGLVGPHRSLKMVRAELTQVSEVARANGATVNDVLLAMVAGGVRSLLASRGEPVDGLALPIFVPVSLRRSAADTSGGIGLGNQISQMVVHLPVGLDDPVTRLHRITAETRERKAVARPLIGAVLRGRLVSAAMLPLIIRQRVNLLSADLVGPSRPLSFGGAPVLEAFPLLNLLGNVTLGVGALSYAGGFDVLVVGDADVHPDLDVFAAGAADALDALSQTVSAQQ